MKIKTQEYLMKALVDQRYELGISQTKMASKLEISTRQYSNLETGKSLCSMKTLALFLEHSGLVETFEESE